MQGYARPKKQGSERLPEQVWVCIASGPSLNQKDVEAVQGENVIAVNDNWRWLRHWRGPGRRVVYGCDHRWWDRYVLDITQADLDAELWTLDEDAARRHNLEWIDSKPWPNLSERDSGMIHQGKNSGFQAVNLAYLFGATTILLLGYDMSAENGTHWFGDHPPNMQVDSPWRSFIAAFESINQPDVEIINCSRETALECFPRMRIEKALVR